MGFAKYSEDNLEIFYERIETMQSRKQESKDNNVFVDTRSQEKNVVEINSVDSVKRVYKDKYIYCRDCGQKFIFTAKKQKNYIERGWTAPKRCKICRDFRDMLYLMRASS